MRQAAAASTNRNGPSMSNFEISVIFFLQLASILAVCRLVGFIAQRLGQPQVVGEMVAGVLMGPSFFGHFWPDVSAGLFPRQSLTVIYCVAQVGLALYMFCVGLDFRLDILRSRATAAASISIAGIVTPFVLGAAIALLLVRDSRFFSDRVALWHALLFMGASMSITAFPMLARIIYERGLTGTRIGTLSLASGCIDDALAWSLLAVVLAGFTGDGRIAAWAVGGGAAYAVLCLFVLRPALRPWGRACDRVGSLTEHSFVAVLLMLSLAAWFTDHIGIYAVFGAFILGLSIPRGEMTRALQERIEPLTTGLLLPLFFIYSGLNTRITLVDSPWLWGIALGILLAACVGKFAACSIAARLHGEPWRDAFGIGALMNARGLMELIILNIGLERGVITPTLFSIMVIMAIVTTLMASPLFVATRPTPPAAPV